jgi:hypothetical protein
VLIEPDSSPGLTQYLLKPGFAAVQRIKSQIVPFSLIRSRRNGDAFVMVTVANAIEQRDAVVNCNQSRGPYFLDNRFPLLAGG